MDSAKVKIFRCLLTVLLTNSRCLNIPSDVRENVQNIVHQLSNGHQQEVPQVSNHVSVDNSTSNIPPAIELQTENYGQPNNNQSGFNGQSVPYPKIPDALENSGISPAPYNNNKSGLEEHLTKEISKFFQNLNMKDKKDLINKITDTIKNSGISPTPDNDSKSGLEEHLTKVISKFYESLNNKDKTDLINKITDTIKNSEISPALDNDNKSGLEEHLTKVISKFYESLNNKDKTDLINKITDTFKNSEISPTPDNDIKSLWDKHLTKEIPKFYGSLNNKEKTDLTNKIIDTIKNSGISPASDYDDRSVLDDLINEEIAKFYESLNNKDNTNPTHKITDTIKNSGILPAPDNNDKAGHNGPTDEISKTLENLFKKSTNPSLKIPGALKNSGISPAPDNDNQSGYNNVHVNEGITKFLESLKNMDITNPIHKITDTLRNSGIFPTPTNDNKSGYNNVQLNEGVTKFLESLKNKDITNPIYKITDTIKNSGILPASTNDNKSGYNNVQINEGITKFLESLKNKNITNPIHKITDTLKNSGIFPTPTNDNKSGLDEHLTKEISKYIANLDVEKTLGPIKGIMEGLKNSRIPPTSQSNSNQKNDNSVHDLLQAVQIYFSNTFKNPEFQENFINDIKQKFPKLFEGCGNQALSNSNCINNIKTFLNNLSTPEKLHILDQPQIMEYIEKNDLIQPLLSLIEGSEKLIFGSSEPHNDSRHPLPSEKGTEKNVESNKSKNPPLPSYGGSNQSGYPNKPNESTNNPNSNLGQNNPETSGNTNHPSGFLPNPNSHPGQNQKPSENTHQPDGLPSNPNNHPGESENNKYGHPSFPKENNQETSINTNQQIGSSHPNSNPGGNNPNTPVNTNTPTEPAFNPHHSSGVNNQKTPLNPNQSKGPPGEYIPGGNIPNSPVNPNQPSEFLHHGRTPMTQQPSDNQKTPSNPNQYKGSPGEYIPGGNIPNSPANPNQPSEFLHHGHTPMTQQPSNNLKQSTGSILQQNNKPTAVNHQSNGFQQETYVINSDTTQKFQRNFYELTINEGKNSVASAPSAYIPLAMIYNGADGNTAVQMREVLGLPQRDVLVDGRQYLNELNTQQETTLKFANKLFLSKDATLEKKFLNESSTLFNSPVCPVDVTKSVETANIINTWVSENTKQKINNLVGSDDITVLTKTIIASVAYFKGAWVWPFPAEQTKNRIFNSFGKNISVPTMTTEGLFTTGIIEETGADFVEVPYAGEKYRMVIILTPSVRHLKSTLNVLKRDGFRCLQKYRSPNGGILRMPKFSIESTIDLAPVLINMNLTDAFDMRANFLRITKDEVKIDKYVQKAFISVDEAGTEAGAASAGFISTKSAFEGGEFNVDTPFLFFITNEKEDIIFEGFILDPTQK